MTRGVQAGGFGKAERLRAHARKVLGKDDGVQRDRPSTRKAVLYRRTTMKGSAMDAMLEDDTGDLLTRHKLSVGEYYRMAEAGILGEDDRVELIEGEIIDMAPIGVGHASVVTRITRTLVMACGDRAVVSVQNPVRLDEWNEPQPDFAVLQPRPDFYGTRHPGPADVLLLVEVSDSSLRYDRVVKLPLYARAGIAEVWVVDLRRRAVHAFRVPSGDGFAQDSLHHAGDTLNLAAAAGIVVTVNDLIG